MKQEQIIFLLFLSTLQELGEIFEVEEILSDCWDLFLRPMRVQGIVGKGERIRR